MTSDQSDSVSSIPEWAPENMDELLTHYLIRSKFLFDRDPQLRQRFNSEHGYEFHKYIDTEGILYFRELQEVAVPFPPSTEMITVGGETDLRSFLATGCQCFEVLRRYLPQPEERLRILDFGVGCARTMRHFYRFHKEWDCYGCDVDRRAIAYLKEFVPFIHSTVSGNNPPLPYEAEMFDCIYSISVFTHLNKKSFLDWIEDLARISKPNALVLPTLHGTTAMKVITENPAHRSLIGIKDEEFAVAQEEFECDGFTWMTQAVGSTDIDTSQYGICFLHEDYLSDFLDPYFEVLDYQSGAIGANGGGGWQDLAVLRRRAG